jgi:D-alanyl-D-alanine carboxypeptidase
VASATRNGVRLLAVVLGESSGHARTIRAEGLLEHGFLTHGWKTYFAAPTAEDLPAISDPKGATSIRKIVMATECGNRRRVPTVAEKRQKAKQTRAAQAGNDAAGKSDAAATASVAAKARSKAANASAAPAAPATK